MDYIESLFSLKGKNAIVTGASRGNGKSIAYSLLKSGANVLLIDILQKELKNTKKEFLEQGLSVSSLQCDITKAGDLKKLKNYVSKYFQTIEILVNNAGITLPNNSLLYPDSLWEKTYDVNLKAPFQVIKTLLEFLKKTKSSSIINITSLNAELAFPNNPAYAATKGGLKQLTKALAVDYGKFGIRVNNIGPGYIHTKMTEKSWNDKNANRNRKNHTILNRWGVSEDLSGMVIFLASNSSSYITGQDFYVDGGWLAKGI